MTEGGDGDEGDRVAQVVGQVQHGAPQLTGLVEVGNAFHFVKAGAALAATKGGTGGCAGVLIDIVVLCAPAHFETIGGLPQQLGINGPVALVTDLVAGEVIVDVPIAGIPQGAGAPEQVVGEGHVIHAFHLVAVVVAYRGAGPALIGIDRLLGHVLHGTRRRVATEQGALRTVEDLDTLDVVECHLGAAGAADVDTVEVDAHRRVSPDAEI